MKEEIISESRSEGQQIAHELGTIACKMIRKKNDKGEDQISTKVVLVIEEVRRFVADRRRVAWDDHRVEKPLTLRQALVAAGMREPKLRPGQARQRHNVVLDNGDLVKSYVVANFEIEAGTGWLELKPNYKTPSEIWPL